MADMTKLVGFISALFTDSEARASFEADPVGTLESYGVEDCSPQELHEAAEMALPDLPNTVAGSPHVRAQAYLQATSSGPAGYPSEGQASGAAQAVAQSSSSSSSGSSGSSGGSSSGSSGGASSAAATSDAVAAAMADPAIEATLQQVITEVNYITNITQIDEGDVNNFVDNSVNQAITAFGDVNQTFDNDTITASGDGAVAGEEIGQAVTGDQNVVAAEGAELEGVATGDGAVAAGGDVGAANTGTNTGIVANEFDAEAVAVGGDATNVGDGGVLAGGDVTQVDVGSGANVQNAAFGEGNTINDADTDIEIDASDGSAVAFGGGDVNNTNVDAGGGNVNLGGEQTTVNAQTANLGDGSIEQTQVNAQNANVGDGTQTVDQSTDITDSYNTDNSVNDSYNTDNSVNDSYNDESVNDSYNEEIDTQVNVDDPGIAQVQVEPDIPT